VKPLKQADGLRLYGRRGWEAAKDTQLWFEECLVHFDDQWSGQPFRFFPWQLNDLIYPIFGTLHPQTGRRRYKIAYVEIPKKNGKSILAAGIALKLLLADGVSNPHVVSAAADKENAKVVFDMAAKLVEASPILKPLCRVLKDEIVTRTGGVYKAISKGALNKHGPSFSGIIFDELHTVRDREIWDVITPGIMARQQGLIFAISTAGHNKDSLCWEVHQRAERAIKDPASDPTFFGKIYQRDETLAWDSLEAFASVNPSYGKAFGREAWEYLVAKAKQSEADQAKYRQLHLNEWDTMDLAVRWIPSEVWALCA
jgi:phage terminase large subunit-like protein